MYTIRLETADNQLIFPVNPQEISYSYPTENQRYNIIEIGEVISPQLPNLCEISWESYFPRVKDILNNLYKDESQNGEEPLPLREPLEYVVQLFKYQYERQPVKLVIMRDVDGEPLPGIAMDVVVDEFETTEKGGEPGDIYYKIKLAQYRAYAAKIMNLDVIETTDGETVTTAIVEAERPKPAGEIAIGSDISVTGRVHRSSSGDAPGRMLENYAGKISHISDGKPMPYHITTPGGAWLGWVTADSVTGL